jgi:hypothetical protein
VVSRTGAYELVCGLLGRTPDWQRFRGAAARDAALGPLSDRQLAHLVEELIGTVAGSFNDGVWHSLFGAAMPLAEAFIASASWMGADNVKEGCSGYYNPATNQVVIRAEGALSWIRETIIHEFVHNWQFRGGDFDLDNYLHSAAMRQYFDGKLIIEGHAVWSENLYRLFMRRGPVYSPHDGRPWDEYKAGYLLMEGIEKVVGQEGLFAWLRKGEKRRDIRSRDPRLPWPFTLEQALDKLDLRRFVRAEAFTNFDVDEGTKGEAATAEPETSAIA